MTTPQIIELAAAVAIFAGGVWLYRRPSEDTDHYGSQGAVILFVIAVLLAIHGLGLLNYQPSPAELGQ